MSSYGYTRRMAEALHAQHIDQERLFQLIAALANCLDRDAVIGTMQTMLAIEPVEKGDCVQFDDVAVRFGDDGRVKSLYRVIDGSNRPADPGMLGGLPGRGSA